VAPGPETRSPGEMPTAWRVKSFAHERGFGVLVHESGEEATFGIDVWDLGSWTPPRKDAALLGAASPVLPREGEPVVVRWKASRRGGNVPALVQPTGRSSEKPRQFKLDDWLRGIHRAGEFRGLTASGLLKALEELEGEPPDEWSGDELHDASDFAHLLMSVAAIRDVDPEWAAAHAGWIYSDDHRWDRERARATVPAMLGLGSAPEPAGPGESLGDYAARCNAEADRSGGERRLHTVALDGDAWVFVALPPAVFASLVADGYLAAD